MCQNFSMTSLLQILIKVSVTFGLQFSVVCLFCLNITRCSRTPPSLWTANRPASSSALLFIFKRKSPSKIRINSNNSQSTLILSPKALVCVLVSMQLINTDVKKYFHHQTKNAVSAVSNEQASTFLSRFSLESGLGFPAYWVSCFFSQTDTADVILTATWKHICYSLTSCTSSFSRSSSSNTLCEVSSSCCEIMKTRSTWLTLWCHSVNRRWEGLHARNETIVSHCM